jgi:hypothetical protein
MGVEGAEAAAEVRPAVGDVDVAVFPPEAFVHPARPATMTSAAAAAGALDDRICIRAPVSASPSGGRLRGPRLDALHLVEQATGYSGQTGSTVHTLHPNCSIVKERLTVGMSSYEDHIAAAQGALRDAASTDGLDALAHASNAVRQAEALQRHLVAEARRTHSWTEIGDVLGVTKQAAQQRFGAAHDAGGSGP